MAGLIRTVAPETEPISLGEAKEYLRLEIDNDDDLIDALIAAARDWIEQESQRQLITATWRLSLDAWPEDGVIRVPRPPLQSVTSITYVDADGETQTLDADLYRVDTDSEPATITPAWGQSWPAIREVTGAIRITYEAGYGDEATDVPEPLRLAMRFLVLHWYENRESVALSGAIPKPIPLGAESILLQYRTGELWVA